MLKKSITYTNIDGKEVTEDFYFNISKAELAEMELSKAGGMVDWIKFLEQTNDGGMIIAAFKDLIAMSVGERTQSGRFIKTDEIRASFMSSEPYSVLFMELIQNPNSITEFLTNVLPSDLVDKMHEVEAASQKEYTEQELLDMDDAQFLSVAGPNPRDWSHRHLQVGMQRKMKHNNPQPV